MRSMPAASYEVRKNLSFSKLCMKCIQEAFLERFFNRFLNSKIVFWSFSKQKPYIQEENEIYYYYYYIISEFL